MKRFYLSSFVVVSFIVYALTQKPKGNGLPVATAAPVINQSPSSSSQFLNPSAGSSSTNSSQYKDGTYTGDVTDAYYGNVQVQVAINNGKITDVKFLDYPQDRRTSQMINSQAMPDLIQETISAQTANVDIVSGATATSQAFIRSLQSALTKAQS